MNSKLIYPEESFAIRGALFEVHKEKGAGFLEPVYQECLEMEFRLAGVPAIAQPRLQLDDKGTPLRSNTSRISSATTRSSSNSRR